MFYACVLWLCIITHVHFVIMECIFNWMANYSKTSILEHLFQISTYCFQSDDHTSYTIQKHGFEISSTVFAQTRL